MKYTDHNYKHFVELLAELIVTHHNKMAGNNDEEQVYVENLSIDQKDIA